MSIFFLLFILVSFVLLALDTMTLSHHSASLDSYICDICC
jgi:hypothetical protein